MDGECGRVNLTDGAARHILRFLALRDVLIRTAELACQPIAVFVSEVVVTASVCASVAHHERYRVEHTHARTRGAQILSVAITVPICEDETVSAPEE